MRMMVRKCYFNFFYFFNISVTCKMEQVESRSVIKFLHLKGYGAWKIHEEMKAVFGDDCPSYDTVVSGKGISTI